MAIFESENISVLVNRNLAAIKNSYEILDSAEGYQEFVREQEAVLESTPIEELKLLMGGVPSLAGGPSSSMSRHLSMEYAYFLTRYAESIADEDSPKAALIALVEASYYVGLSQGVGLMLMKQAGRSDPTINASRAATIKHARRSDPVKQELLKLLGRQKREERWKSLDTAIRSVVEAITKFIEEHKIRLKPENLPDRVKGWCQQDNEFQEQLGRFVQL